MRGKPTARLAEAMRERNIPAYAGKTAKWEGDKKPIQEHPRVCGENADNVVMPVFNAGTSPRARGKRPKAHRGRLVGRNIPACAGKTSWKPGVSWTFKEHPRVRGENRSKPCISLSPGGTSPRARGKHRRAYLAKKGERNIPACAGKTSMVGVSGAWVTEHPRVRGENRPEHMATVTSEGTSPRARGKRIFLRRRLTVIRNIPACAGKT